MLFFIMKILYFTCYKFSIAVSDFEKNNLSNFAHIFCHNHISVAHTSNKRDLIYPIS